jgi:hypothetical protein
MTDQLWSYSSAFFPLPSLLANPTPILELADPVLWSVGQFFASLLNSNLLPRFADEAAKCGLTSATFNNFVDGSLSPQITTYPLNPMLLKTTDFKFPLLNVYVEREEFHQLTLNKTTVKRDIVVSWILPPLIPRQYNHLYPFFGIVSKAVSAYMIQGFDPKVSSVSFWQTAGLSFGSMEGISYKPWLGMDKDGSNAYFPSIQIRFSFYEKNEEVAANYIELTGISIEEDLVDGYNIANPIKNFIDGYAYTSLALSSVAPVSGSVHGGTWLLLAGEGFSTTVLKAPQQIRICGAQAAQIQIVSPSLVRVLTSPGISTGTGNVVLTDISGNAVQLLNAFTYT